MSPWALLGIAPTADAAAIRRAYARKLKLTRPDDDPEGFQRLMQARDAALKEAAIMAERSFAEAEPEPQVAPVLAAGEPIAASADQPPVAMEPVEADALPIIIREIGGPDPAATLAPPIARIVVTDESGETSVGSRNGFSLEASERHWRLALELARKAGRLLALGRAPDAELVRLIDACGTLPRGPRQEVEAALIEAAGRELRLPNGAFNRIRVEQVRAIFTGGEAVFGWLRDDTLIHKILGPRDAAAFCLIGQEEDDWKSERRPRLPGSDARVMFAGTRKCLRVFERFRQRGRPAWHFDAVAFLAPMLWTYYYRQTALAFAIIAVLTAAGVLMMAADGLSDATNLAGAGLFLATPLATALLSDRLILWAGARTVTRARRELCYDPKLRSDFLRREGPPRELISLLIFALFSSAFLTAAYVAAYVRLEQAVTALAALMGW
ncbi:MAG: hypothetical protein JO084_00090 [Bradyrhizobiaceae bacterium]|nr:hypothetical protein [Hyphomicrobiales bacterium]MBV9426106.1 hypothetical protein [Bradyrhizobiaceae bacterium]